MTFDARQRLYHVAGVDLTAIEGIDERTAFVLLSEMAPHESLAEGEALRQLAGVGAHPRYVRGPGEVEPTGPGVNRAEQALRLAAK